MLLDDGQYAAQGVHLIDAVAPYVAALASSDVYLSEDLLATVMDKEFRFALFAASREILH